MRKQIAWALCFLLGCLPLAAMAEEPATMEAPLILTGKVEAKNTTTLYAPFGGMVEDFTLRPGDIVEEGEALLSLNTIKVYAPLDGTVRGVFAMEGDSAAYIQSRYGALCYIEPDNDWIVAASASQGFDSPKNRVLHIGEQVYLRSTTNSREGEGRIIAISGDTLSIEVTKNGTLSLRDNVNVYRNPDYNSESRIGRGMVLRTDPIPVSADGSLLSIAVSDGLHISRGELLFELVSGTFDEMQPVDATVYAPHNSVVADVSVMPGQTVNKNTPVATLYQMDTLQLTSSISEVDAEKIAVGDAVKIEFDSISDATYEGTIAAISGIGSLSDNYTQYAVTIDFTPDALVRLGMSGTAYPQ